MLGPSIGSAIVSVSIEKPVENISEQHDEARTVSGRIGDHRRETLEVGLAILPDDLVLDRGDLHRRSAGRRRPFNRWTASSSTSSRLQNANRTRWRPASALS